MSALSQSWRTSLPHAVQIIPSLSNMGFFEAHPPLTSASFIKNKRIANKAKPIPKTVSAKSIVAIPQM